MLELKRAYEDVMGRGLWGGRKSTRASLNRTWKLGCLLAGQSRKTSWSPHAKGALDTSRDVEVSISITANVGHRGRCTLHVEYLVKEIGAEQTRPNREQNTHPEGIYEPDQAVRSRGRLVLSQVGGHVREDVEN